MLNLLSFYLGGAFVLAIPAVFTDTKIKLKRAVLWPYYVGSSAYFLFWIIVLRRDL